MNRLAILTLALLAAFGASTRVMAKVHVSQNIASGIFATNYDRNAPVDDAGTLDIAGRNERCSYELVSGQSKWLNRDPMEKQGGANLCGIAGNDLMNRFDFLGLEIRVWECRRPLNFKALQKLNTDTVSHSFLSSVNLDGKTITTGAPPPTDPSNTFSFDNRPTPPGRETFPDNFTYTIRCRQISRWVAHGTEQECCTRHKGGGRYSDMVEKAKNCCLKTDQQIESCLVGQIVNPSACSSDLYDAASNNCHQNNTKLLSFCCAK